MADRYSRQISFANKVFLLDCPVTLEKGAVLFDTHTNTYVLQLKFSNIGTEDILSARAYIQAYDGEGNPAYKGIYVDYDEYAHIGEAFGTKKLLPLPDNNAETFCVYVEEITTADGDVCAFSREQYTDSPDLRDIAAERDQIYGVKMYEQEAYKSMWGANWYNVVFAIVFVINLGLFIALRFAFLIPILLVFAWVAIGTPNILKRSALLALLSPISAVFTIFLPGFRYGITPMLFVLLLSSLPNIIPFACVFFNAKRFDCSLDFMQSLFFFSNAGTGTCARAEQTAVCFQCGAEKINDTKFCAKCGIRFLCPQCNHPRTGAVKFCAKCGGSYE
jgi:hypothetical protein